ncbi:ankyrin repeat domain-containing protein [Orientia tsutsugamushi]|uniref:ankyrin repeat domain-containing protein n=1 Tax=Orientia tsutsugamushi TaxID=784 RepID=UPI003528D75B
MNEQNSLGQTILHIAAKENNYKAVKYLLQSEAKKILRITTKILQKIYHQIMTL